MSLPLSAVVLPESSVVLSRTTNVLEVRVPKVDVHALQSTYELIFELQDGQFLVIRKPSVISCTEFVCQFFLYAARTCTASHDFYVAGPGSWFRGAEDQLLCPEFSVSGRDSYHRQLQAAGSTSGRGLGGVDLIMMLNFEDNDTEAEESVEEKAKATKAAAFGLVVSTSTVFVAHYAGGSLAVSALRQPRYIDVGAFAPRLHGLRLYPSHCVGKLWDPPSDPGLFRCPSSLASRLVESIEKGSDEEDCCEMINLMNSLNVPVDDNNTPLLAALRRHRFNPCLPFIQYLIDAGANCDFQERQGLLCPHLYAAAYRMDDVLELMPGECVHRKTLSAKHLCCARTVEMMEVLLRLGVQPNGSDEEDQPLAAVLCRSFRPDPLPLVKLLIDAGADPTLAGPDDSALFYAVRKHPRMGKDVLRLVAMACGPDKIDTDVAPKCSALGLACLSQKVDACQVLLECGASPDGRYLECGRDLKVDLRVLFKLTDTPLPDSLK